MNGRLSNLKKWIWQSIRQQAATLKRSDPQTAKVKPCKVRPWRLVTCIAFSDERKAADFNDV
jgi:hypothetical protein